MESQQGTVERPRKKEANQSGPKGTCNTSPQNCQTLQLGSKGVWQWCENCLRPFCCGCSPLGAWVCYLLESRLLSSNEHTL